MMVTILDHPNSLKLAKIIICDGFISEFAALEVLTVEKIQKGSINLHPRNLATESQIPAFLVEDAVRFNRSRNSLFSK